MNIQINPVKLKTFYSNAQKTEYLLCRENDQTLTLYKNLKIFGPDLDHWCKVATKNTQDNKHFKSIQRSQFDPKTNEKIGQSIIVKDKTIKQDLINIEDKTIKTIGPLVLRDNKIITPANTYLVNCKTNNLNTIFQKAQRMERPFQIAIFDTNNPTPLARRIFNLINPNN